eukprot:scaffold141393_cov23-Tisochrysis_lutea.AAC.1
MLLHVPDGGEPVEGRARQEEGNAAVRVVGATSRCRECCLVRYGHVGGYTEAAGEECRAV